MAKWVDLLTADRKRQNYWWVKAYFKDYPVSENIIVMWEGEYRSAFKSYDGNGFIISIPNIFGSYNYEFMPVFNVRDFHAFWINKFNKINFQNTGNYGPEIPPNLRKALAEEELLVKILTREGFDARHIYKSGWGFANPRKYTNKKEIHSKSRFDIEIHDNGQARKLIDVVGVESFFTPNFRTSSFDPKLFDDKRRAKIYLAWSLNYSLSVFAIVKIVKIRNMYSKNKEYGKELLNDLRDKKIKYFPTDTKSLIFDALDNKKIICQAKNRYKKRRQFVDLFQFADDLYKKDMADFKLINLRANRKLFCVKHIPFKKILPYAISPDAL